MKFNYVMFDRCHFMVLIVHLYGQSLVNLGLLLFLIIIFMTVCVLESIGYLFVTMAIVIFTNLFSSKKLASRIMTIVYNRPLKIRTH